MTISAIADFIIKFGPSAMQAIPLLEKLYADIKAGRAAVEATAADWAELTRLTLLSSAGIYAKLGIALPVPALPVAA